MFMWKLSCPIGLASGKNSATAIPRSGKDFHPHFFCEAAFDAKPGAEMAREILLAIEERKA